MIGAFTLESASERRSPAIHVVLPARARTNSWPTFTVEQQFSGSTFQSSSSCSGTVIIFRFRP